MKLSIVICTYNSSKTLPKTLDSVLTQSYNSYEILIVDGLSSDNTLEIIKSYEKKFNGKLRWISEKDGGVYEAMNKGIDLAKGDWIYFLGSDDIFHSKNVLKKIFQETEKSDLDVIYGSVEWGETKTIYDGKFSVLKMMIKNICHQAIFFKKSVFEKYGKFETKYKILADYHFNIKWFNNKKVKRKYIDLVVAKYNINGLSSRTQDEYFIKDKDRNIEKYFPQEYSDLNKEMGRQTSHLETIEKELENLKNNVEDLKNNVEEKNEIIESKNNEIENLNKTIRQTNQEITFIKSSKFWKMREKYLKLKNKFNFFIKK